MRFSRLLVRNLSDASRHTEKGKAMQNNRSITTDEARLLRRIRMWLAVFIGGLVISGLTAFPLVWEINLLARLLGIDPTADPAQYDGLRHWIALVRLGITDADAKYPFLAYGTDWLAFGHLIIALFFLGPWRDPVRNVWCIRAGMAACVLVLPLALVCGPLRGIPFFWQLIDCSFGVLGSIPLLLVLRDIRRLENNAGSTP
jgi:hypothetical protein